MQRVKTFLFTLFLTGLMFNLTAGFVCGFIVMLIFGRHGDTGAVPSVNMQPKPSQHQHMPQFNISNGEVMLGKLDIDGNFYGF